MLEIEIPVSREVEKILNQLRRKQEFQDDHWLRFNSTKLVSIINQRPTAIGRSEYILSPVQWLSLLENLDKLELLVLECGSPWYTHPSFQETLREDPTEAKKMVNFRWLAVVNLEARAALNPAAVLSDQGVVELYITHNNGTEIAYKQKMDWQYCLWILGNNQLYQTPFDSQKLTVEMPLNEYQIMDHYLQAFLFKMNR